jgi:hypothetical protein
MTTSPGRLERSGDEKTLTVVRRGGLVVRDNGWGDAAGAATVSVGASSRDIRPTGLHPRVDRQEPLDEDRHSHHARHPHNEGQGQVTQRKLHRRTAPRRASVIAAVTLVLAAGSVPVALASGAASASPAATTTTAWKNGTFNVDVPNVVRRSDIVLGRANTDPTDSMPLGNGTLGAAVWAAGGFTAQLNRNDTMPDRKSPGQVVIPGLSKLTGASDFHGYLDAYDGMLHESGGGMSLTAYVRADTQEMVVDVTGADPNSTQTAQVKLWSGRNPQAQSSGPTAALSETWTDNPTGGSGKTFGSLAGISAGGRNVTTQIPDSKTVQVAFNPNFDGTYRVVVAAPSWTGGNAIDTVNSVINGDTTKASSQLTGPHTAWWHNYWAKAGIIKITSGDGTGEYMENLRNLYLYDAAAERGSGGLPGSQAGVADLFNFSQDHQDWFPAGYWFWNMRMQVQANMDAGEQDLNAPVFQLYSGNVGTIGSWTSSRVPGKQGLCVPETMRFNGNGYYNNDESNASCDANIAPSYNSLTLTTGAEVGLWVWQRYLMTDDRSFLSANYPLMSGAAKFLLSEATTGSDGKLHTKANAHETQWNVTDPTTDITAMQALFPVVVKAAQTLGTDGDLVNQLNAAIPKIPALPRTDTASQSQLLTASDDAAGKDMIGLSTQPTAERHNSENLGLEAVWPYNLITDSSGSMTDLAKRTYTSRSYVNGNDWSYDSLDAARLGMSDQMVTALTNATTSFQKYPSGMAAFTGSKGSEPYVEQSGVVAATLGEAFVQDYDGLVRIAPSWPSGWTGEGTVYIQHNSKVSLQVENGTPATVAITSGSNSSIAVRNPWPGQNVTVVDGGSGATVVGSTNAGTITIPAQNGKSYLVERVSAPTTALPFAQIGGSPASSARHLGNVSIGL